MDEKREGVGGQPGFGTGQKPAGNWDGPKAPVSSKAKGRFEDIVDQTRGTVRDMADQASDFAEETYERGRRYVREQRARYPEVDRYVQEGRRVVRQEVGEHPILVTVLAFSLGYLFGYLIHGLSTSDQIPDYARKRAYERRPHYR